MSNIHFSANNRQIPDYKLNHPKSMLEQNNVRFQIDGHYLKDFTEEGIEDFIDKHVNDKSGFLGWGGKDLELKEVKAFIRAAAANAENLQGVTFDLTDPQLGLFDDDDISVKDIKHSFSLEMDKSPGSSATEIAFVDVKSATYDFKKVSDAEKAAKKKLDAAQKGLKSAEKDRKKALEKRNDIVDRLGSGALEKLAEFDNRLEGIENDLKLVDEDMKNYRRELTRNDLTDRDKRQLRMALRGLSAEKDDLIKERKKIHKDMDKNKGFWSFLGGGSDFHDLRKANEALKKADTRLAKTKESVNDVKADWQKAVDRRKAVEGGKSLKDILAEEAAAQAAAEKPADEQPAAEKPPAEKPPAESPEKPATPASPAEPVKPAAEDEVITPQGEPVKPAAPSGQTGAVTPAAQPSASDVLALEQQFQNLVLANPADQAAGLNAIPEKDRQAFLKVAHDYIRAGSPDNPLGLKPNDFEAVKGIQTPAVALLKNAFATYGEGSWDTYMQSLDAQRKADLQAKLQAEEFAQLMAARSQAAPPPQGPPAPPAAEKPVGQPEQPAVAADAPKPPPAAGSHPAERVQPAHQPSAPLREDPAAAQGGPVTLQDMMTMSPEERLQRFFDLSADDQKTALASFDVVKKGDLLFGLTQTHPGNKAGRAALINELNPQEKAQIAQLIQQTILAKQGQNVPTDHPEMVALTTLADELGVQPVAPQAQPQAPAAPPQPDLRDPSQLPQPPADSKPPVQPAAPPKPPVQPAEPPKPPVQPAAPSKPPQAEAPPAGSKGESLAKTYAGLSPQEQAAYFIQLPAADQLALFNELGNQPKAEALLAVVVSDKPEQRQALINSLKPEEKQAISQIFLGSMPEVHGAVQSIAASLAELQKQPSTPQLEEQKQGYAQAQIIYQSILNGTGTLLNDLGVQPDDIPAQPAQTAQPQPQPAVQPDGQPKPPADVPAGGDPLANLQPTAEGPPPKLDMSDKLSELEGLLKNKTYFGYGGVAEPAKVSEMAEQIWVNGTVENRHKLAKALVDNGSEKELARILANQGVSDKEVADITTKSGFPLKEFMDDIDDGKAGIILISLATEAANGNQKATQAILDTVKAYQSGIDREGPIKRMKTHAEAGGLWSKMPASVHKAVDNMFNTWWN